MDAHLRGNVPEVATFRDPVCGMEAPPSRSAGEATYRGVTYRFCSHECHVKLQADPGPYVDAPKVTRHPMARIYAHRYEEEAHVPALPPEVYAVLDDHARFIRHMAEPSWRALWSTMRLTMDEGAGRRPGSHIMMESRILGLRLHLDEAVTLRESPTLKEWETTGRPRLLVIGHHRMRAEVHPDGAGSRVRVSIEYDLPERNAWLGRALGAWYARWCVRQMTGTLAAHFAPTQQPPSSMAAGKTA